MLDYTQTSLHFKILKDIGQEGKNSTVHIAHDNQLDSEIVVKKINKSDFKDDSSFFDEAKMLYSSNHPNIAPIQYSCQDVDYIYITMPLFQKGSLNSIIDQRPLTVAEIVKYSIDFLSGLHHIHSKRLLHCDIKPTNILVSDSNDAILTDFGLARYLNEEGLTLIDKFYHFHRAPETIQSNEISFLIKTVFLTMTSFFKPFLKESFPIEVNIYIIFLKHLEIISERLYNLIQSIAIKMY